MDFITVHINEELEPLDWRKQDNQQDLTKHIQTVYPVQEIFFDVTCQVDDSHCHCCENIEESILAHKVVRVTHLRRVTDGELHVHCEGEEVLPNHRAYTTHIAARKDIDDYIDSGWLWWVLFKTR